MDRYENSELGSLSRTKRNQDIYSSTDMSELSRIKTNTNVSVISDAPKEIDIEKIKKYINSINNDHEEKRKRISLEIPQEEEKVVERQEPKTYDINSVLEQAREKKETNYEEERHRKLNNTGYDILKTIKIREEQEEKDDTEELTEPLEELNTQEKTIVNLIQNIQQGSKKEETSNQNDIKEDTRDLFQELMGDNENTVVMAPIDEDEVNNSNIKDVLLNMTKELEAIKEPNNDITQDLILEKEKLKQKYIEKENNEEELDNTSTAPKISSIDKSFYTNSISFNKTDFEGFEDLEKSEKKSSIIAKLGILLIIVILGITIFLILNSIFEWNII